MTEQCIIVCQNEAITESVSRECAKCSDPISVSLGSLEEHIDKEIELWCLQCWLKDGEATEIVVTEETRKRARDFLAQIHATRGEA